MDTSTRKAFFPAGWRGFAPASVRRVATCCWWGFLLLLLSGCELFKPPSPSKDAAIRSFFQTDKAEPTSPAPTLPASTPGTRVGTKSTAAQPAQITRAPTPPHAQSQPRPAEERKTPPAQPAKGAEKLIASRPVAFRLPISDSTPRTAPVKAAATTSSATAGIVSRPVASQLIVKGPPRPRHQGRTGNNRLLLPALGLLALVAALAIYSKRGRLLPTGGTKSGEKDLVMPGEFKMKDPLIRAPTAMGMLVPEARRRSSIFQGLLAVVALAVSKVAAFWPTVVASWKARSDASPALPSQPQVSAAPQAEAATIGTPAQPEG